MTTATVRLGRVTVGAIPRVVGTISRPETLRQFRRDNETPCDIAEVRLDLIGADTPGWLEQCEAIEAQGLPVLLTIRLKAEGGQWTRPEARRLELFDLAVLRLSALDIELQSELLPRVSEIVRTHQKVLVVSHHDFARTPDIGVLSNRAAKAAQFGSIVKIATTVNDPADVDTLRDLLAIDWGAPLCVIGMGEQAAWTRAKLPAMGSCLAYGYLDAPAAPGQMSAVELVQHLKKLSPSFRQNFTARHG